MPTQITQKTVEKAARDAAAGLTYDVTDSRARRLILRVGKLRIVWAWRAWVRKETWRLTLGNVDEINLTTARAMADEASRAAQTSVYKHSDHYLKLLRHRHLRAEPEDVPGLPTVATVREGITARGWFFDTARTQYLEYVAATLSKATHVDYRKMLGSSELDFLRNRPVASITRLEIAGVLKSMHRSGRERHAEHLASVIRPFWSWLAEDHQIVESKVEPGAMARLAAPRRTSAPKPSAAGKTPGTYLPSPSEMGIIVAIVRSGAMKEPMSTVFELLLATAQRRRVIASALVADFAAWDEQQGWGVWSMGPSHRKTALKRGDVRGRHAIPLPPALWSLIKVQIRAAGNAPWLFPQARPRKAADRDGMTHLSDSALNHRLADMAGLGVRASPHDIRRALSTHGQKTLKLSAATIKLLLDHNEGYTRSDVLETHYTDDDRLDEKMPVMMKWTTWLDEQAASAKIPEPEALARLLTDARPKPKRPRKVGVQSETSADTHFTG